jgi:hypothetical protein
MQKAEPVLSGGKYVRRHDLTPSLRLFIACTALMAKANGTWGKITELARQFMISRMFVYMLANNLQETGIVVFGDHSCQPVVVQPLPYHFLLSLRLEGRCSIEAISTIMKRFGLPNCSTGFISRYLHDTGALLPNTISNDDDQMRLVVFLSDEIFAKKCPILVTVDPISSVILRIELADSRKVQDWQKHWECIEKNGHIAVYLVTDEGKGLCGAHKQTLQHIVRQPDTYHAIAHQLGKWVDILERTAMSAIQNEYRRWDTLDSARSEGVINDRIESYEQAKQAAEKAIELYENFAFLYSIIIKQLNVFDGNGNLRDRKHAEQNIETALLLLKQLGHTGITRAVEKVERILNQLLNYFDTAQTVVDQLSQTGIDTDALKAICLAWQWRKMLIKSKKPATHQYCKDNEQFCIQIAQGYLEQNCEIVKEQIYEQLNQIVQSSALVECINSIIRPYLNGSKNQVTQETLNLIMFYHNHRRYLAGKRKGKTPMEILTGKKQKKDWIELLFEAIGEKEHSASDFAA